MIKERSMMFSMVYDFKNFRVVQHRISPESVIYDALAPNDDTHQARQGNYDTVVWNINTEDILIMNVLYYCRFNVW